MYARGRQKAVTKPAYCVAVNSNNSQANQNITMHSRRIDPTRCEAKMDQICAFQYNERADFDAAPHHARLCSEHFAECDFADFVEYRISKRKSKPAAFPSVQKLQNTGNKTNDKRICEADFQQ